MSVAAVMERYKEHGDIRRALHEAGYPHLASAIGSGTEMAPKSMRESEPGEQIAPDEGDAEETAFERNLKERDRAREQNKTRDTANTMRQMDESTPKHKDDEE
jgi:hypothetical protein